MRWLLRALGIVAVLALAGAGWVAWRLQDRPDLSRYARYEMSAAPPATRRPRVSVSFLGVATLLFSDGETHLMTDGWFTRPGPIFRVVEFYSPGYQEREKPPYVVS